MKKPLLIFLFFAAQCALAQTTVTGTIVDPNGNPYANGTVVAVTVVATGQKSVSTSPIPLNSVGFFSTALPAAIYTFSLCGSPVNLGPQVVPPPSQICFVTLPITVSGSGSLDISTTANAVASILGPKLGGVPLETNGTPNASQLLLNLQNGTGTTAVNPSGGNQQVNINNQITAGTCTNCNLTYNAQGQLTVAASGSSSSPTLDNCTPDQSGFTFYSVTSLTNYFDASWVFCASTSTCTGFTGSPYINCTIYVPTAATGATIVLDIAANDGTAGHTANFQTCDGVINSGTINTGSLTCAAAQTFTTTSTAYNRVTLTFNVQSTLSNGSILVVKILTSTTGTAPTANMLVYPHFVL
jgi:hypothetical protein